MIAGKYDLSVTSFVCLRSIARTVRICPCYHQTRSATIYRQGRWPASVSWRHKATQMRIGARSALSRRFWPRLTFRSSQPRPPEVSSLQDVPLGPAMVHLSILFRRRAWTGALHVPRFVLARRAVTKVGRQASGMLVSAMVLHMRSRLSVSCFLFSTMFSAADSYSTIFRSPLLSHLEYLKICGHCQLQPDHRPETSWHRRPTGPSSS